MRKRWLDSGRGQYDGLFDYENTVRPAYFAFKLLLRLRGERLRLASTHPSVRGFLSYDERLGLHNLLLWNFSASTVHADLILEGIPKDFKVRSVTLDAVSQAADENSRLRQLEVVEWMKGDQRLTLDLDPYALRWWAME